MKREELSVERQLVLMGSIEIEDSKREEFAAKIASNIDWSEVVFQLITHRTLNMFYYNLKKFKLTSVLEKELQRMMETQLRASAEKNNCYLEELATVLNEFAKYQIVTPIVKGNMLITQVYPVIESRIFNDVDLIMKLDDVSKLTQALEGIGYVQGHFDAEKGMVVEASRKEKILQQVASHELQEFQKVNQNRFCNLFQVDVNHDILWKGNCPYKVPTKDLIDRAVKIEIKGAQGYMLDYIDNIIQLSCHLYKEATLMLWITDLRDLKIYKFADLQMFIRKFKQEIDWDQLIQRVKGYGLEKVVYYNFYYIGLMFDPIVPEKVMRKLKPDDLSYLDEYGIENEKPARWEYDFFTRLFDTNRILTLEQEHLKKMDQFIQAKSSYDGVMNHRRVES